ncbi:hypothetical protein GCM10023321_83080 [Pseudonocardia eucalypti]|uniref:Uncharacterized protein n=1 Tax=Pseudonocardia eucalypti TaxID=648755 RepID=A0ABP9REQ2_9PSEU|nr:hypothetical protein [Pseudonocardia eucalypti]
MNPPGDAPVHMVVDPAWQWGFGLLHFGVAALTVVLAARGPIRQRDWRELTFRMVVLFSGALGAVVFEGAVDRAGKLWYAEQGAWPLVTLWGVHVPLWVAPVYLWFIGGGALVIIQKIRNGGRPRDFLYIFGGIAVADLLLEIPIIKIAGLYTYYGDNQPFFHPEWFPLPLWFITTNRLLDLVPAMLILVLMSARSKHVMWAIPVVMFGSMYVSYAFVTWPTIAALHSGASALVAHLAATYTIVIGLLATYFGAQLAPRMKELMKHHEKPRAAPDVTASPLPVRA